MLATGQKVRYRKPGAAHLETGNSSVFKFDALSHLHLRNAGFLLFQPAGGETQVCHILTQRCHVCLKGSYHD